MTDTTEEGFAASGTEILTSERLAWEVPELIGLALMAAFAVVVVVVIVGAAIPWLSQLPQQAGGGAHLTSASTGQFLQRATAWASPLYTLLVLSALGLSWWQATAWEETIDDDVGSDPDGFDQAFGHMLRARGVANGAIVLFLLLAVGAIGSVVGTFLVYPELATQHENLAAAIEVIGLAIATGVLVASGIWAALRIRSGVDTVFAHAEAEENDDED